MGKNIIKKGKIKLLPRSYGLSMAMLATFFIQEVFLFLVMLLDILPAKYTALLIAVLLLLDFGIIRLMNSRKKVTNKRLGGLVLAIAAVNVLLL